jgi:anti-anti-sigma factor
MQRTITYSRKAVVQPSGHISADNAESLRKQLSAAVSAIDCSHLVVDMTSVQSLDSAGLMVFVSTLTQAQQIGKQLTLCGVSPSVRIVFELTQLDRVFEILDEQSLIEATAA